MSWAEFFDMGGYAFYVWTSYGITLLALVLNLALPLRQHRNLIRRIVHRQRQKRRNT